MRYMNVSVLTTCTQGLCAGPWQASQKLACYNGVELLGVGGFEAEAKAKLRGCLRDV